MKTEHRSLKTNKNVKTIHAYLTKIPSTMKNSKLPIIQTAFILLLMFPFGIKAQTGPGGIGNSTTNRIWLDASTISSSDGSFISAWTDKSGNGLTTTSDYSSTRPVFHTNQLNGFPSIEFDGTNDFLKISNATGINTQAISWFIVGNFNSLASSQTMLHFSHTGSSYQKNLRYTLYHSPSNKVFSSMLKTNGSGPISNHARTTSTQILSTLIGPTSVTSFTNGNQTGGFTSNELISPVNSNAYVSIGRRASINDMYLNGNVAEVIVFNYELTTPERVIVENYLSSKYNQAMSANDHYAYETGGYHYNVTGIGMEDGISVTGSEGGTGITMSDVSALDDDDYLLWGHNNASKTENLTDLPAEVIAAAGSRLNRVWRIDETNDMGTYTLNFEMTGITLGTNPEEYILLIDDDGDFSNGGTTIDSLGYSWDGINQIASFTNKDLPDGAYFTIGFMPKPIYSITDGSWSNPSTWNCNCLPTTNDNVIIEDSHEITVDIAANCKNLDITETGTLIFTEGNELSISGNVTSAGILDGSGGVFTLNGNTAQSMNVVDAVFDYFIMQNPVSVKLLSGNVTINVSLTVNGGVFIIGNDLITLNSDASTTASIKQSTGTISGSMIIERFVAAQPDGWTTMSSPVSGATFAQWEDDFTLGFGPYIPNVSEPSAYGYSEAAWDYYAIENNAYLINPGVGFEVYLSSDYSVNTPLVATVAELRGTPNMGDITFNATVDNDGWNLLGNPYASFIDWETFRNNCGVALSSEFMYYDESINDYSVGYIGDEIAQSEGLWVEALAPGTITFHESDKTNNISSDYRNAKEVLFALKVSTELTKMKSHTYFRFDENADNKFIQGRDQSFLKLPDPKAPSLFTHSSEGKNLRINELLKGEKMSIPVSFKAGINGEYQIEMQNFGIIETIGYTNAILEDKQTGTFFNLKNGPYTFMVGTDDLSERFTLHLSMNNMEAANEAEIKFTPETNGIWINHESILGDVTVKMFNTLGQEISQSVMSSIHDGKVFLKLPESYSGVYIIQVNTPDVMVSKQFYKN